jgi:isopentenyldiphosphate isomerase
MNKKDLFRSIAPGLMPLIVLIVAELIWGIMVGIIAAACFSVTELLWHLLKHKKFEKSVLLDFGIIAILGVVAYFIEGEMLDKYRFLFYIALLLVFTGISGFSEFNIASIMSIRYLKNMRIGPYEVLQMKQSMKFLFFATLIYTCITVISIILLPERISDFLSNTGIFIALALFFIIDFLKKRYLHRKYRHEEWLPLIDSEGKVIGIAPRSVVHSGKNRWLHPVVHLHLLDNDGIWLQKRPMHKDIQPGKWDTVVGGHFNTGESVEQALARETMEEIGIDAGNAVFLGQYLWESHKEREMVFSFAKKYNGAINPNRDELDDAASWKFADIEKNIGKRIFTPNFEHEYMLFKKSFDEIIRAMYNKK